MTENKVAKGKSKLPFAAAAVVAIGLVIALLWWHGRGFERTDDAQVDGRVHPVAARVAGHVQEVRVTDNDAVEDGAPLVVLDDTRYRAALQQAEADLAAAEAARAAADEEVGLLDRTIRAAIIQAEAALASAKAQLAMAQAQQVAAEAAERLARDELERTRPLVERDLAPQHRLDALQASWDAARSSLVAAEANVVALRARLREAEARVGETQSRLAQVDRARALRDSATAQVEAAQAKLERAQLDLADTTIVAPAAGVVTRKYTEAGQYVQPGQTLMLVVPLHDTWVVANFKETQLTDMAPGQPAELTVDAYPGVVFAGEVDSIAAGTGARFSLMPAENATGNFVKIVQRVPVKIRVKRTSGGPILRPGMNVIARVRTSR